MASNYVKLACMDSECHNFDRTKDNNCGAINDAEACKHMGCRRTEPYKFITETGKVIYRR
ncbi:MAG: hypothetical protein RSB35_03345 [Eubacterium sp.]